MNLWQRVVRSDRLAGQPTRLRSRRERQLNAGGHHLRGTRWIEETARDLCFAGRLLLRDRSFTLVAVITLALGIGANTAMFSVIESVLLQPLPFRDPDRMVWITENNVTADTNLALVFGGDLEQWRSRARSFDALSVLLAGDTELLADEPFRVRVACVSERLARLFGVAPAVGRDFESREFDHAPAAPGLRGAAENRRDTGVAVLSDRLFRRLGGDPEMLGASVVIGDVPYTVVGVLPPSFRLPVAPSLQLGIGARTDADVVLNTTVPATFRGPGAVLARLKPGVPIETAVAELEGIRTAANQARPKDESSSDLNLQVISLHEHVVAGERRMLLVLLACVMLVLLVACVNIISLLLARSVARQQETAIRTALGAGRWRLVRQALAENMTLAFAGGLAGVWLAHATLRVLTQSSAIDMPRLQDATLNGKVMLFSGVVCAMSGILLSVIPALRSGVAPGDRLKAGAGATMGSGRMRRWHSALVVCELGLALIALTGAGLMLRSLWQVRSEGAVLAPHDVLTARIRSDREPGAAPSRDTLRQSDRLLEEIESLPGVRAAALWSVRFGYPARIAGLPRPEDETVAMWFDVSPRFRDASGLRLVAGRWFTRGDRGAAPPVVVVSERLARSFAADLPHPDSIVGRTTFGPFPPAGSPDRDAPMTIVGVVSDFRSGRFGILQPDDSGALPQVFFPDALRPMEAAELLVRAASGPLGLADPIRRIVAGRPGRRLAAVATLDSQMSAALAPRRFSTKLMVAFGGIALLLATVGVSGVLRYAVAQRTHEIGLRMALGARRADIRRMILSYAGALVSAGVVIGLVGSVALSTLIGSLLYGVSPTDPSAYAAVVLLLVAVALVAAYLPARRAMRVSPMVTLRRE